MKFKWINNINVNNRLIIANNCNLHKFEAGTGLTNTIW
jgi:hypothetical protein